MKPLNQLIVGDRVAVEFSDGEVVAAVIRQVLRYPFDDFNSHRRQIDVGVVRGNYQYQKLFDADTGIEVVRSPLSTTIRPISEDEANQINTKNAQAKSDEAALKEAIQFAAREAWNIKVSAAELWFNTLAKDQQEHVKNIAHKFCIAVCDDGYAGAELLNVNEPDAKR